MLRPREKEIRELALISPIIHAGVRMADSGFLTWEEALARIVETLDTNNRDLLEDLMRCQSRRPMIFQLSAADARRAIQQDLKKGGLLQ